MMKSAVILVLATLATSGAQAAWQRIASIDLSTSAPEFVMQDFNGNAIGLTAQQSDVACNRVSAVFPNGDTRPLFRGRIPKGLGIRVDLPPGPIDRITFDCHSVHGRRGMIDLAADTETPASSEHG